jgi:subfamily B ATP-binding cassette protein MsbA
MSGGGKAPLVNLIPRFFDVTGGHICIDDKDIREYRVADLRREIAIVTQDPILFNETVRDNIAYGIPRPTEKSIVAAKGRLCPRFHPAISGGLRYGDR